MVQQVLFSHWLGRRQAEVERSTQTLMHQRLQCVRPGPASATPRLGRASAAAALPWRPQGAASSS
ncbi:hypothetical protein T492DRAFT_1030815 [Pavlovales sp. CCMP2436]|nr:hypothetical protein T492DRAFT_1030815 [Pavlovales sp. CCMP2436]